MDHRTATRAIELLEAHQHEPFFIAVGFAQPHPPFVAPKSFFDLYAGARIELPPDFAPRPTLGDPSVPAEALRPNFDLFIDRDATPALAREAIAAYYAATSFVDAEVGRVLQALDRLRLRDRTIVVFLSDHGFHLGEKGMWSKQTLFERSARVPLIIALPSRSAGAVSPRTVQLIDLYPTLVELCGLPLPRGLEGHSLAPLLQDPRAEWDHPAYTTLFRGTVLGYSVRTERYRYTEWDDGRRGRELYDHDSDPHELRNRAGDLRYAPALKMLQRRLQEGWRSSPPPAT